MRFENKTYNIIFLDFDYNNNVAPDQGKLKKDK